MDVQHAQVTAWADTHGHQVVHVCRDEAVSGTADMVDRPSLTCAMASVGTEADAVVVARLDRRARSLTIQEAILTAIWRDGGRVFAVDQGEVLRDDPFRTAMRQVAGVFAQLDRALIVKRLCDGRRVKGAQGAKPWAATRSGTPRTVRWLASSGYRPSWASFERPGSPGTSLPPSSTNAATSSLVTRGLDGGRSGEGRPDGDGRRDAG